MDAVPGEVGTDALCRACDACPHSLCSTPGMSEGNAECISHACRLVVASGSSSMADDEGADRVDKKKKGRCTRITSINSSKPRPAPTSSPSATVRLMWVVLALVERGSVRCCCPSAAQASKQAKSPAGKALCRVIESAATTQDSFPESLLLTSHQHSTIQMSCCTTVMILESQTPQP